MNNFDVANIALKAVCPSNEMIVDDKGMPSFMVKIPKCTWADLGIGTSTETFPAFIINGQEVDAIYFSKYQNVVQNNRAYSLPAQDPATSINLDTAHARCSAKGPGFHLTTRLERMAIAHWCVKNGFQPKGNNNYGKDHSETVYKAIPTLKDGDGKTLRVATGTGPLSWSHNNAPDGIWDMNGNILEWDCDARMVNGELQVISHDGVTIGNDAADPDNSCSASSSLWRAIDGTTGELIVPNGSGTTPNSLKADWVSGHFEWITGTQTGRDGAYHGCSLESITVNASVCEAAIRTLQAYGFYKVVETPGAYNGDYIYFDINQAERSFCCGGNCYSGAYAGLFYVYGHVSRSDSGGDIGFRSAFVELPTV